MVTGLALSLGDFHPINQNADLAVQAHGAHGKVKPMGDIGKDLTTAVVCDKRSDLVVDVGRLAKSDRLVMEIGITGAHEGNIIRMREVVQALLIFEGFSIERVLANVHLGWLY